MSEDNKNQNNVISDYSFPPERKMVLCSYNTCRNGHQWPPTVSIANCPGCSCPLVAVKMENCPICNEPVESVNLRHDHVAAGLPIVKFCLNEPSPGEVTEIKLDRQHAKQMENAPANTTPFSVRNPEKLNA